MSQETHNELIALLHGAYVDKKSGKTPLYTMPTGEAFRRMPEPEQALTYLQWCLNTSALEEDLNYSSAQSEFWIECLDETNAIAPHLKEAGFVPSSTPLREITVE